MAGLLDFLQAASNAAASNVSGPVDMLGWALKKAGVPVGQQPVLGSEWMKQKGLMRDVPQSAASLAGETVGLLSPIGIAAKAPQIAAWRNAVNELAESGAGRMPFASQRGAVVYHGSPHKFDKFDSSKIGTGEGAQAYGHGLYLADTQNVAKTYAEMGQDDAFKKAADAIWPELRKASPFADDAIAFGPLQSKLDKHAFIKKYEMNPDLVWGELSPTQRTAVEKALAGNLYKVDLPDEQIAKMLDWDKPLSQQAGMVQKVFDLGLQHSLYRKGGGKAVGDFTGADLISAYGADTHSKALLAEDLRKAGIPGIRYLDGGSRTAGQGTSNYVVFPGNEGVLSTLERNGVPIKGLID
jgi:hypothetical protein